MQYVEDFTQQFSFKINEKCQRNFKIISQVITWTIHFCLVVNCDISSFYQKTWSNDKQGK